MQGFPKASKGEVWDGWSRIFLRARMWHRKAQTEVTHCQVPQRLSEVETAVCLGRLAWPTSRQTPQHCEADEDACPTASQSVSTHTTKQRSWRPVHADIHLLALAQNIITCTQDNIKDYSRSFKDPVFQVPTAFRRLWAWKEQLVVSLK